jgi:hypothetical protein
MGDTTEQPTSGQFPGGRWWRGVNGKLWYLRRNKTSPPDVRRYGSREELAAEIDKLTADHERWQRDNN